MTLKYTEDEYKNVDLFQGEESELSCVVVKMVRARKEHKCFGGLGDYGDGHVIHKGDLYRYESALVDGDFFGKYRLCIPCMDKWLDGDIE